jgi:hypothetical protein
LCGDDGHIKVLDFGLAKLLERAASDSETKTRAQRQTGTPDAPRSKAGLHVGP